MKQHHKSILIFIYSLGDGGAERVIANLANHWVTNQWQVTLVTMAPISMDLFELLPTVNRISLGMAHDSENAFSGLWRSVQRVVSLRKILKQIKPEIALALMTRANIILALAAWRLTNIKTIGSERSYPGHRPITRIWQVLRKYTYALLDAITAMSSEGRNWLLENTCAKQVYTLPNPISWPLPVYDPRISPQKSSRRILLAVGRLTEVKGFDLLITAFAVLKDFCPEWDLYIVGEGGARTQLETQISSLGLNDRIFLPGRAGNIGEWYENADLYVMSSRVEGFPNTLAEAMASGLAAISFDCDTGPRDIIRHELDGLLVTPGDSEALAIALKRLMMDDRLRKQFAGKAVDTRERFSMNRIVGEWESMFMTLRQIKQ